MRWTGRTGVGVGLAALVLPLLSLAGTASGAADEPAPVPAYVALGDSYASGTGTRRYLDDGTRCERSVRAYPSLIATARGYELTFRACSGSTVADVERLQLDALSDTTSYVTVSVGGNDAGFAEVLTECALPAWASRCHREIDQAQAFVADVLPGRLDGLYAAIRDRAPSAKVVVVGYPRLFNGTDCNALTWFSTSEMNRLNVTANRLNRKLTLSAKAAGFRFSKPTKAFLGHAVCDRPEWVNGLSFPVTESYHPNRRGHRDGYTPLVSPKLTGVVLEPTARVLSEARRGADELAGELRRYAARDASVEPARVELPDLTNPEVRRAARRAGVDLSDPRSIDRADRAYAAAQARAHRAGR